MKKSLFLFIAMLSMVAYVNAQWTFQPVTWGQTSTGVGDISVVDENIVWAVGYDGTGGLADIMEFAKTIDGGTTWTVSPLTGFSAGSDPSNIVAVSADRAFIMAYGTSPGATFWETSDGGVSWSQVELLFGGAGSFANGVTFWDDNVHGFCHGDFDSESKFELYYTDDSGDTWTESVTRPTVIENDEYSFNGDDQMTVAGTVGYIITNYGRVLKTVDNGVNWEMTDTDPYVGVATAYGSVKIYAANENIVLCKAYDGAWDNFWMYTDNGGITWSELSSTGPIHNNSMCRVPGTVSTLISTGAAEGDYGVSKSTDGGLTWEDKELLGGDPPADLQALACGYVSEALGYVGNFDYIFKYENIGESVDDISNNTIANVFPNPTSGYLNIQISNFKNADIKVIDILGKVVANYYDISSEITIDLTNRTKGLYFVQISSDNVTEVQKIIVK